MRMSRVMIALPAAALLAVAGCRGMEPALGARVAAEAAALEPAVEDDDAVRRVAVETAEAGAPPPGDAPLPPEAGLEDVVRLVLRDNPAIRRTIRRVEALGWRVPQVTSLDDPMVTLVPPTGDLVETAAGRVEGAAGASQRIPFPGKLESQGRIAEHEVRMALDALADARITAVAQALKAWFDHYLADVSIQIDRESQTLLGQIRDVAAARYRAGAATQQDVLRAEVELYDLTNEIITREQERATAAALLNSLMDRRVEAPIPPPRAVELAQVEWRLTDAMARAVESNPRLARVRDQVRRDLEVIRRARLDYLPDLSLGLVGTFVSASGLSPVATGDDAWGLGIGLNLPVWWRRLRARVLEGNAQVLASVEEYREMRNLVFFQLQDTLVRIDTQYRQAVLLRDAIVPRAWQAVEVSTAAYQAGRLEFTALIENWRRWLDLSLGYHRSLAGMERAFADLQQLIGVRVGRAPPEGEGEARGAGGEGGREGS